MVILDKTSVFFSDEEDNQVIPEILRERKRVRIRIAVRNTGVDSFSFFFFFHSLSLRDGQGMVLLVVKGNGTCSRIKTIRECSPLTQNIGKDQGSLRLRERVQRQYLPLVFFPYKNLTYNTMTGSRSVRKIIEDL